MIEGASGRDATHGQSARRARSVAPRADARRARRRRPLSRGGALRAAPACAAGHDAHAPRPHRAGRSGERWLRPAVHVRPGLAQGAQLGGARRHVRRARLHRADGLRHGRLRLADRARPGLRGRLRRLLPVERLHRRVRGRRHRSARVAAALRRACACAERRGGLAQRGARLRRAGRRGRGGTRAAVAGLRGARRHARAGHRGGRRSAAGGRLRARLAAHRRPLGRRRLRDRRIRRQRVGRRRGRLGQRRRAGAGARGRSAGDARRRHASRIQRRLRRARRSPCSWQARRAHGLRLLADDARARARAPLGRDRRWPR